MTSFLFFRPVTPPNAPRATAAAHPSLFRAASHNLRPADAYHAAVLWKRRGRKAVPCLSCPCRKRGFGRRGRGTGRNRAAQGGTLRNILLVGVRLLRNACEVAVRRDHLTTNPLTGRSRFTDKFTIRHCREVAPTPAGLKQIGDWLDAHAHAHHADLTQFQKRPPNLRILMPRAGTSSGGSPFRKQVNSNSLAQHYLYLVGCLYWQANRYNGQNTSSKLVV